MAEPASTLLLASDGSRVGELSYREPFQAQLNAATDTMLLHLANRAGRRHQTARIRGRKLRPLFEAIRGHKAGWVQETASPPQAAGGPEKTLVTEIKMD